MSQGWKLLVALVPDGTSWPKGTHLYSWGQIGANIKRLGGAWLPRDPCTSLGKCLVHLQGRFRVSSDSSRTTDQSSTSAAAGLTTPRQSHAAAAPASVPDKQRGS